MENKVLIPTILFVVVLVFSFFVLSKENKNEVATTEKSLVKVEAEKNENEIILFYGIGCPHCEIVDDFIEKNNIEEKITFSHKEVYYDKENSKELGEKAKLCGMPTNSIGVPFLWDGKECLTGDKDIIDFFKEKTN